MRTALLIVLLVGRAAADEPKPAPPPAPQPAQPPATQPAPPPPPVQPPGPAPTGKEDPFATFSGGNAKGKELFLAARELLKNGNQIEACARFAESYAQEEAVSTQLNLALCRENEKKYAEAWRLYQDAAKRSNEAGITDRARVATDAAAALDDKLATVVVRLAQPIARGTSVTVNNRQLETAAEANTAFINNRPVETAAELREKVDPGTVLVIAKGPTGVTSSKGFQIFARNTVFVDVPTLQEREGHRQPLWIVGSVVLVGAGVIAIGTGEGGVQLVGGAAIVGGIAVFLLAPKERVTVVPMTTSSGGAGVALAGHF